MFAKCGTTLWFAMRVHVFEAIHILRRSEMKKLLASIGITSLGSLGHRSDAGSSRTYAEGVQPPPLISWSRTFEVGLPAGLLPGFSR